MTSDPVTLVVLLYDKAVLSLKGAIEAIGRNQIEARWRANNRAMEIIKHLILTLDMEKGGEIASNLEAIYGYMLRRLLDVDMKNDARAAEEVIQLLEPLRSSWSELAKATRATAGDNSALRSMAATTPENPGEDADAAVATSISLSA